LWVLVLNYGIVTIEVFVPLNVTLYANLSE
jgi:hypothetical protein